MRSVVEERTVVIVTGQRVIDDEVLEYELARSIADIGLEEGSRNCT